MAQRCTRQSTQIRTQAPQTGRRYARQVHLVWKEDPGQNQEALGISSVRRAELQTPLPPLCPHWENHTAPGPFSESQGMDWTATIPPVLTKMCAVGDEAASGAAASFSHR